MFAVKYWENLIDNTHRERLEKYITGIVQKNDSKLLAIYCNPDHVHVLIGLNPKISASSMARIIKANSSKWINQNKWFKGIFKWQEGFGVFSYSRSQVDSVAKYILNQAEHHKKSTFKEEYMDLLKKSDINFNEKYLFDWKK